MNDSVQFQSKVGDDGILNLQVNLGNSEARKSVRVTIEPMDVDKSADSPSLGWHEFIARTYGSCAGLGLDRQSQGEFEIREPNQ